jgi:hypothetical protein
MLAIHDSHDDSLNEELSRILLYEPYARPDRTTPLAGRLRFLLNEWRRLARRPELDTDLERSLTG